MFKIIVSAERVFLMNAIQYSFIYSLVSAMFGFGICLFAFITSETGIDFEIQKPVFLFFTSFFGFVGLCSGLLKSGLAEEFYVNSMNIIADTLICISKYLNRIKRR